MINITQIFISDSNEEMSNRLKNNSEKIKELFPDIYALKEKDGILQPEAIADAYWFVHTQHRSAWTHELDLRPYMEKF